MSVDNSAHIKTANLKGLPLKDFFKGAYALSDCKCCVCNTALRDAESVEVGIGPTCRKKYGYTNAPASNVDLAKALTILTMARIDQQVFMYIIANKDSVRMMNNILVAYSTFLMGQRRGVEIVKITPAMRELGYGTLAAKLEIDRTKHKFLDMGNGNIFFRTASRKVEEDMYKYLKKSPQKIKGYAGNGFVLDVVEDITVAEWLVALHCPNDLAFINGGAALLSISNMTEPSVIANYVAPIDASQYAFRIESDGNRYLFSYPYPNPTIYYGMKNEGLEPEYVQGHRGKKTVLHTAQEIAYAIWLMSGVAAGQSAFITGQVVTLQDQASLPQPAMLIKTPAQIGFEISPNGQGVAIKTPVPWNHTWVKDFQADLKKIGAKFVSNGKYWQLPPNTMSNVWALVDQLTPYSQTDFV